MDTSAKKPDGGFVFISVRSLTTAWTAYRRGNISLQDLRFYLAANELKIKHRCEPRAFDPQELEHITGKRGGRRAVEHLEDADVLVWTRLQIGFAEHTTPMLLGIPNNRRKVPFPRRILRYLAREGTSAEIAVMFAVAMRCLYYRNSEVKARGRIKCSWISDRFGLDIRTVKKTKAALVKAGIIETHQSPQWMLNRWGCLITVNLCWQKATPSEHKSHPLSNKDRNPEERKDKNPPDAVPLALTKEDLKVQETLEQMHESAVKGGLIPPTESDKLNFYAAAFHALRVGDNPVALFRHTIKTKHWEVISQADEDQALQMLRAHAQRFPSHSIAPKHLANP